LNYYARQRNTRNNAVVLSIDNTNLLDLIIIKESACFANHKKRAKWQIKKKTRNGARLMGFPTMKSPTGEKYGVGHEKYGIREAKRT